ncbi:MAG: acetyl-CoA carboxylase biotin carboxylase subunit [Saprospiraceae bacterium]|nr:acetyl-CoA carboxylase biotin carboxylase subunit [Saprospiraceae bacterium]MBP7699276.1 acetyl-CoA carboxylase biotin carboxylase subunit [Saprospiraceae bacterium]
MQKILIANRGEIAIRVMKTAKKMNIKTVAVYSEADRNALHVRYADEAVFIGASPSNQSYLVMDKIIAAAKQTGADAIHPGYGFLSENAAFAEIVAANNITFIGPSAYSINVMGSKLAAKETVSNYNIPMVPGTKVAVTDAQAAKQIATEIGYPILVKASAGGGGKGMRVVQHEAEFEEQLQRAQSEALASFGDSAVFIEKYVASPKHIEVQIMADKYGNTLYFFERECSIQRRHQKLVEEAPSSCLSPDIRKAIGEAAVRVARACQYYGAGTVEFLVDDDLNFYFLEMNTRLQVEHPVTEMITGFDLVEWQIRVADGEQLSIKQEDLSINGHAIELRICAEDPRNNFLPSVGVLTEFIYPQNDYVRLDTGYLEGDDIPIYYDPMIAKLIVHGSTREEAIQRMIKTINNTIIREIPTTLEFGKYALQHPSFVSGNYDTHFVTKYFKPELLDTVDMQEAKIAALTAVQAYMKHQRILKVVNS